MSARAMYKASLQLDGFKLPVKLYAAAVDRRVHFRLLHASDGVPLKQRLVDPDTGEPVTAEDYQRAYAVEADRYLVLTEEEQAALAPEPSRAIEVLRLVPKERLNHQWYTRPYYLGPDGRIEAYFALAQALELEGREAVVRWVMRRKEYHGALSIHQGYLLLCALRHADEVVDSEKLPRPGGRKLDAKELKMAEQLIGMLSGDFEAAEFEDEYRARLQELIEKKSRGEVVRLPRAKRKRETTDSLKKMLQASLQSERKKKVA